MNLSYVFTKAVVIIGLSTLSVSVYSAQSYDQTQNYTNDNPSKTVPYNASSDDSFNQSTITNVDSDVSSLTSTPPSPQLLPDMVPLDAISPNTIETFVEVINVVRQDYIEPVNDEVLFEYAIKGMLENLDSHAEYLSPDQFEKLRSFTDGEIGRVGITARFDDYRQLWVVEKVVQNSSAKQANIRVGDKLLRIKNIELTPNFQSEDITQLLSGIAGSKVSVTVVDSDGFIHTKELQRDLAQNLQLDVKVQGSIAVIRLPVFQNSSKEQLVAALKDTQSPITGIVIDVRNNPGGVLSSALDIASLFVTDEELIQVRNRNGSSQTLSSTGGPYLLDLPVIVLQNRYSASAAEVLSSSLKTNHRATIVGETSYGKGTVQEVVELQSGGALKLTVAEYVSARGETIDGVGIVPDIELELNESNLWQLQAVSLLNAQDRPIGVEFNNDENVDFFRYND